MGAGKTAALEVKCALFGAHFLDRPESVRYNARSCGPVAQLGARLNRTEEVEGSTPSRSTLKPQGPIAQLGARLNGIEKVEGSNPSGSTTKDLTGSLREKPVRSYSQMQ